MIVSTMVIASITMSTGSAQKGRLRNESRQPFYSNVSRERIFDYLVPLSLFGSFSLVELVEIFNTL
jgi:hypothetical protein